MEFSNSVSGFNVEEQNAVIQKWAPKVKRRLKNRASMFSKGKKTSFVMRKGRMEGKLFESISARLSKKMGIIELVSFQFERHGVFVHKGVGRGWEISGNAVSRTAKGTMSAARNPNPWFNSVIDMQIPLLANSIATVNANAALNAVKLHIK